MKVYVAERHIDYEGFTILGVFSTKELAENANASDTWEDGRLRGNFYEIEEYELKEKLDINE